MADRVCTSVSSCARSQVSILLMKRGTDMQMLDQNFEYIKVISDCQKRGMTEEANKYSAKLKDSLAVLARQAERQPPSDINQVRPCGGLDADIGHHVVSRSSRRICLRSHMRPRYTLRRKLEKVWCALHPEWYQHYADLGPGWQSTGEQVRRRSSAPGSVPYARPVCARPSSGPPCRRTTPRRWRSSSQRRCCAGDARCESGFWS